MSDRQKAAAEQSDALATSSPPGSAAPVAPAKPAPAKPAPAPAAIAPSGKPPMSEPEKQAWALGKPELAPYLERVAAEKSKAATVVDPASVPAAAPAAETPAVAAEPAVAEAPAVAPSSPAPAPASRPRSGAGLGRVRENATRDFLSAFGKACAAAGAPAEAHLHDILGEGGRDSAQPVRYTAALRKFQGLLGLEDTGRLDTDTVKSIQKLVQAAGGNLGPDGIDGKMGPATLRAMRDVARREDALMPLAVGRSGAETDAPAPEPTVVPVDVTASPPAVTLMPMIDTGKLTDFQLAAPPPPVSASPQAPVPAPAPLPARKSSAGWDAPS